MKTSAITNPYEVSENSSPRFLTLYYLTVLCGVAVAIYCWLFVPWMVSVKEITDLLSEFGNAIYSPLVRQQTFFKGSVILGVIVTSAFAFIPLRRENIHWGWYLLGSTLGTGWLNYILNSTMHAEPSTINPKIFIALFVGTFIPVFVLSWKRLRA